MRPRPDGRPVSEIIGAPQPMDGAWFRCKWLGAANAYIAPGTNSHWEPAWHGCKLEALYSIMYHRTLFESSDHSQGQRYLTDAPGIYLHKTGTKEKAENYINFMLLCDDGVFWGCKWEVEVDRERRVKVQRRTDQWVQKRGSIRFVALWLRGIRYQDMQPQMKFNETWNTMLEANPHAVARDVLHNKKGCTYINMLF